MAGYLDVRERGFRWRFGMPRSIWFGLRFLGQNIPGITGERGLGTRCRTRRSWPLPSPLASSASQWANAKCRNSC
jgi:hypothetical protein